MEDKEIQAIRKRCEAASRGPWEIFDLGPAERAGNYHKTTDGAYRISADDTLLVTLEASSDGFVFGKNKANAEFIVYARQDIPALLSEVERQRTRIEELENIVGQLRDQQSKIKAQSDFAHRVWREKT